MPSGIAHPMATVAGCNDGRDGTGYAALHNVSKRTYVPREANALLSDLAMPPDDLLNACTVQVAHEMSSEHEMNAAWATMDIFWHSYARRDQGT